MLGLVTIKVNNQAYCQRVRAYEGWDGVYLFLLLYLFLLFLLCSFVAVVYFLSILCVCVILKLALGPDFDVRTIFHMSVCSIGQWRASDLVWFESILLTLYWRTVRSGTEYFEKDTIRSEDKAVVVVSYESLVSFRCFPSKL